MVVPKVVSVSDMEMREGKKLDIVPVALFGAGLVLVAAFTLLAAPLGYRFGIFPLRLALLTVFRWGAYAAAVAAAVSAVGLGVQWFRPRQARFGLVLSTTSFILSLAMFSIPASFRLGPPVPPIHDITTDTEDPPLFVAVVPLNSPDRTVYEGEVIAVQQREAYPDLQPVVLDMPAEQAFDQAFATVQEMGWEVVEADAVSGRIEATDTTFWFGFKDDVVIRLRTVGSNTRVDIRSLSRVGGGDVGKNAQRIRAYISALTGK